MAHLLVIAIVLGLSVFVDGLIDLTHPLENGKTRGWPGVFNKEWNFKRVQSGLDEKLGLFVEYGEFSSPDHTGTHTDAPSHFGDGKYRMDEIPFKQTSGLGVVIDISQRAKEEPDTMVSVNDIKMWEEKYGHIPDKAVVIINTGYHKHYVDNPDKYYGYADGEEKNAANMNFPTISKPAMEFLVFQRNIVGLAIDTISFDGPNTKFPAHQVLAGNNIWGIENIANLDALPPKGFLIYNPMMKIQGGSGAPSRVFAVLPDEIKATLNLLENPTSSGSSLSPQTITAFFGFALIKIFMRQGF